MKSISLKSIFIVLSLALSIQCLAQPSNPSPGSPDSLFAQPLTLNDTIGPPVPVEFIKMTVAIHENCPVLSWSTATERNNSHFIVYRGNGKKENWEKIATIAGSGTTKTQQNYQWRDSEPPTGTVYYSLHQVDYDDKTTYLALVVVNIVKSEYEGMLLQGNIKYVKVVNDNSSSRMTIVFTDKRTYKFVQ